MNRGEQVSGGAEPRQESHHGGEVERRYVGSTGVRRCAVHIAEAAVDVRIAHVKKAVMQVQVHVLQAGHMDIEGMKDAQQHGKQADDEAHERAHEIEISPGHGYDLLGAAAVPELSAAAVALALSGRSTCKSRSARFGVSRMARINTRHLRESSWRAISSRAWLTSASRRNCSAPLINHKSSLSSVARKSEINSVW